MNKFSGRRVMFGCLFAALGALATPLMLSFGATLLWPPILIALLYAWSGAVPALLCAALVMVSPGLFMALVALGSGLPVPLGPVLAEGVRLVATNANWMTAAALALVLPGAVTVALLHRRLPFPRAVAYSIGAQLLLIAACVLALFARSGSDLVGGFVQWFRAVAGEAGASGASGALMDNMLINMGRYGLFGADAEVDFARAALTAAERMRLIDLMVNLLDRTLRLNLVSMVLTSGATTGLLSYALGAHVCARRGDEPQVPYMHIHEWRLARDMVFALPAMAIAAGALNAAGVRGMDAAYVATSNLCYLAFAIQGAGAMARRLRQGGAQRGARTGAVLALLILLRPAMTLIGVWSALLGSRGVITLFLQKRNQTKGD